MRILRYFLLIDIVVEVKKKYINIDTRKTNL